MKFKVGDKVKVINSQFYLKASYAGKIGTILKNEKHCDSNENRWILDFNPLYVFFDNELELVELVENTKIDITIDVTDKAGAHKAVEDAIAEYKKKKAEWTGDELAQAEKLYKDYLAEFVNKGYIPVFTIGCHNMIFLKVFENAHTIKFISNDDALEYIFNLSKHYFTSLTKDDVFNETIGKVVCLCKALDKPIPDFIKNKNR